MRNGSPYRQDFTIGMIQWKDPDGTLTIEPVQKKLTTQMCLYLEVTLETLPPPLARPWDLYHYSSLQDDPSRVQ
ncbi:hypothetical protein [Absidia glauca]|uniref:Uncharacterized protein n=1 Tax=Absidia glauca TaxID=4829 RepID=A0A163JRJ0_ABSGL|nr:hypothetical protein [Absidia glauca]